MRGIREAPDAIQSADNGRLSLRSAGTELDTVLKVIAAFAFLLLVASSSKPNVTQPINITSPLATRSSLPCNWGS
jgi:hypothetical protein